MPQKWLITDSFAEVVSALEKLVDELHGVSAAVDRWKWVIIALHNSTQGMMVLALQGSHGLHVLNEKSAGKWLEAHDKGAPYPEHLKMDRFLDLYEKVKSNVMLMHANSTKLTPRKGQDVSIRKLNEVRNQLVHFIPQVFVLDVLELPDLCLNCVDVAEFLAWRSGNVVWTEDKLKDRAKNACNAARQALVSLKQQYDR